MGLYLGYYYVIPLENGQVDSVQGTYWVWCAALDYEPHGRPKTYYWLLLQSGFFILIEVDLFEIEKSGPFFSVKSERETSILEPKNYTRSSKN